MNVHACRICTLLRNDVGVREHEVAQLLYLNCEQVEAYAFFFYRTALHEISVILTDPAR